MALGLFPVDGDFCVKFKWVFWTNNPVGNALALVLNELVEGGLLEVREEPDTQYRWKGVSERFDWKGGDAT